MKKSYEPAKDGEPQYFGKFGQSFLFHEDFPFGVPDCNGPAILPLHHYAFDDCLSADVFYGITPDSSL
jgi:hypothetical protein